MGLDEGCIFYLNKRCACAWKLTEWNVEWHGQNKLRMCRIYPYFFERLPKDRVMEQYPFFYSRTGDDMFFFRFLFFKVDLLTYIIMKQIISYIYQLFVPVELASAGNTLSLSWRIGLYLSSTHWFHPYYLSLVQVWWDACYR